MNNLHDLAAYIYNLKIKSLESIPNSEITESAIEFIGVENLTQMTAKRHFYNTLLESNMISGIWMCDIPYGAFLTDEIFANEYNIDELCVMLHSLQSGDVDGDVYCINMIPHVYFVAPYIHRYVKKALKPDS